ncbi:hypothetical protein RU99_GL000182 [Enterococcus casseliflavus]|nr:hypothetical protein RU99_GL000182 [Enterococcus casseliflavus]
MFPSFSILCITVYDVLFVCQKKEQLIYLFYFFMVNHFLLVLFNDQY